MPNVTLSTSRNNYFCYYYLDIEFLFKFQIPHVLPKFLNCLCFPFLENIFPVFAVEWEPCFNNRNSRRNSQTNRIWRLKAVFALPDFFPKLKFLMPRSRQKDLQKLHRPYSFAEILRVPTIAESVVYTITRRVVLLLGPLLCSVP